MNYILLLITMLFCYIVDDYYLQGFLASAKQKSWWEKNNPNSLYKNDYMIALAEHAFSWTVMINVLIVVYIYLTGINLSPIIFISLFIINLVIHTIIDNEKANLLNINLIQDQLIHITQIILTWLIYIFIF